MENWGPIHWNEYRASLKNLGMHVLGFQQLYFKSKQDIIKFWSNGLEFVVLHLSTSVTWLLSLLFNKRLWGWNFEKKKRKVIKSLQLFLTMSFSYDVVLVCLWPCKEFSSYYLKIRFFKFLSPERDWADHGYIVESGSTEHWQI